MAILRSIRYAASESPKLHGRVPSNFNAAYQFLSPRRIVHALQININRICCSLIRPGRDWNGASDEHLNRRENKKLSPPHPLPATPSEPQSLTLTLLTLFRMLGLKESKIKRRCLIKWRYLIKVRADLTKQIARRALFVERVSPLSFSSNPPLLMGHLPLSSSSTASSVPRAHETLALLYNVSTPRPPLSNPALFSSSLQIPDAVIPPLPLPSASKTA